MIKTCLLILFIWIAGFASAASPVYAQPIENPCPGPECKPNPFTDKANTINLGTQLSNSGLGIQTQSGQGIVGTILKNVLTLFFAVGGIGTIIYFLWGAVDWILSGGDKEKVGNARKKMTHALIGLALLSSSFVIIRVAGQIIGFNPLDTIQLKSLEEK